MKDYSIPRSSIPLIKIVLMTIFMGDFTLAVSFLLIIFIRETLQLDTTYALLYWLIFILKTTLVLVYVGSTMKKWLEQTYMVMNNKLIIYTKSATSTTTSSNLKDIQSVRVIQDSLGKKFDYGDITIELSKAAYKEQVELIGVSNPKTVARSLEKAMK